MGLRTHKKINDEINGAAWLGVTACCTALHDIGFDTEEIADAMPQAMSRIGNKLLATHYDVVGRVMRTILPGEAIKAGQDYAEHLAAKRAGVQS